MPSPVGHSLSGIAAYLLFIRGKRSYLLLFLFIVLANLPDFDFIPGWFANEPNLFHRGLSHSFFMIGVVGVLVGIVARLAGSRRSFLAAGSVIFLCSLHVVLDLFSVDYGTPPGFKILWPFSEDYFISPTVIFMNIIRSPVREEFIQSLFNTHNLKAIINEAILFLPLLLLIWSLQGSRRKSRLSSPQTRYEVMKRETDERWAHRAFREI